MKRAHVIGAGLAGLAAALHLTRAGVTVTVHEAAPHAGGRCRSFLDPVLDAVIDNGAHLMLSGNDEVRAYLDLIGAAGEVVEAPRARFDFFDPADGQRWTVDLGAGRGKVNLLHALSRVKNRPPGVGAWTLMKDLGALKDGAGQTVAACVGRSCAFDVFWHPLTVAVLNADPQEAAAEPLWRVLADTVMKGGAFARPLFTRQGLGAALIDPALATLERLGGQVRLGQRVRALDFALDVANGRVAGLDLGDSHEVLGGGDAAVLAVPHFAAPDLLPDLLPGVSAPRDSRAILNVHFRLPEADAYPPMTGLVHSDAQWVFVRGAIASVTVSAADAWMDLDADAIAATLWADVAKALKLDGEMPPHRVIKERRATFAQTPAALALRPGPRTAYANLFLAGDWTATDLPATIEGALKSGRLAAQAALDG